MEYAITVLRASSGSVLFLGCVAVMCGTISLFMEYRTWRPLGIRSSVSGDVALTAFGSALVFVAHALGATL